MDNIAIYGQCSEKTELAHKIYFRISADFGWAKIKEHFCLMK